MYIFYQLIVQRLYKLCIWYMTREWNDLIHVLNSVQNNHKITFKIKQTVGLR